MTLALLPLACREIQAASTPTFQGIELVQGGVRLTLSAPLPGQTRRLDGSEDLALWRPLALFGPSNATPSVVQPVNRSASMFYRALTVTNELRAFRLNPGSGEPGAIIAIEGQFFSARAGDNAVSFQGADATVLEASPTQLRVAVPNTARSGPVSVRVLSAVTEIPDPFIVLRRVTVSVHAPPPNPPHIVFTFAGDAPDLPDSQVLARADAPSLVFAVPTTGNPDAILMAVAIPGGGPITVGSQSTAEALLFCHPLFATRDTGLARDLLEKARLNPEVATLAQFIETRWTQSGDPFADPQLYTLLAGALRSMKSATVGVLASQIDTHRPSPVGLAANESLSADDYSFDLEYVRIATESAEDKPLGPLTRRFTWTYGRDFPWINSVDWTILVNRVDEAKRFPEGRRDLDTLFSVRNPLQDFPLVPGFDYRGSVEAKLITDKANPVKRLVEFVFSEVQDKLQAKVETLTLPNEPGIYLMRAIGPGFGPNDEALFTLSHYKAERAQAIAKNISAAVMDLFGVIIDLDAIDYDKAEFLKFMTKVELEAAKRAPSVQSLDDFIENVVGMFNFVAQEFVDLLRESKLEAFSKKFKKQAKKEAMASIAKQAKILSNINGIFKVTDIAGGLGMVLQRAVGMVNSSAMESSLIIVGEPFRLKVLSLSPTNVGPGSEVTLRYQAPPGLARFLPAGPLDVVEFDGPHSFNGSVLAATGPDTSGVYSITVLIPEDLPSTADGAYSMTVKTHGYQGGSGLTLTSRAVLYGMTPLEGFAAVDAFNGGAYSGSQVTVEMLNIRSSDRVFVPSATGQIEATDRSVQGGLLKFRIPKGAGSGPIRIAHRENNGTFTDVFTPTFTVLGPPVIESASAVAARKGDVLAFTLRNSTAELGTTIAKFIGASSGVVADPRAGAQLVVVPAQAVGGLVTLATPAGIAVADFQLLPGLAKGGTIQIGSTAITSLQLGCDFANGDKNPADYDDNDTAPGPNGTTINTDPPFEPGDFVTDNHNDSTPRFPVGANFADTLFVRDVDGEGVLTGDFETITVSSGFRGVLHVRGNFCKVNASGPYSGTVIIEGNYCTVDGFRSQTTFSGSAQCPLVIRGNNGFFNVRLIDNGGDGLRVEGGRFNRILVPENRGNGGSGVVFTEGAEGNTLQVLSGTRAGNTDIVLNSGNTNHGVLFLGRAVNNTVTGYDPGIGGNARDGIRLDGAGVSNNIISLARYTRNGGNGVTLTNDASFNLFFEPSDPDALSRTIFLTISNAAHGVAIHGGTGNRLSFASSGNGGDGLHVTRTFGPLRSTRVGMRTYDFATRGNQGAGVRIRDGAQGLWVFGIQNTAPSLTEDGSAVIIEGDGTRNNILERLNPDMPRGVGMYIGGVSNRITIDMTGAQGDGVLVENGRYNTLRIDHISGSGGRGLVLGTGAEGNSIRAIKSSVRDQSVSILGSKSDGIVLTSGAKGNRFSDLLVSGNQGHGVLIQGPGTDGNQIRSGKITANALSAAVIGYGASSNILGPTLTNLPEFALDAGTSTNPVVVIFGNDSQGNVLRRALITSTQPPATRQVGVSVRDGAPGTVIEQCQMTALDIGLVSRNDVDGLLIRGNAIHDNNTIGLFLQNTRNYRVGGSKSTDANLLENQPIGLQMDGARTFGGIVAYNTLLSHSKAGIQITGARTNVVGPSNQSRNNSIGIELREASFNRVFDNIVSSNSQFGLRYQSGSSNNITTRNRITANAVGIEIRDPLSVGNLIGGMAIFNNTGKGIQLVAGGNHGQAAPTGAFLSGGQIVGSVNAPDQSIVSVFRDRKDEGEEWLGDATVVNKRWSLTLDLEIVEALAGSQINTFVSTPSGDTSEFAPLTTQDSASPRVVYVSTRDGNPELYVVDAAVNGGSFGAPRRLTVQAAADLQPSLSPDTSRVAFTSERNGQREIYVRSSDPGGAEIRITNDLGTDEEPVWLTSDLLLFTSNRGGSAALFRVGANGVGIAPWIQSAGDNREAAVSTDGKQIAFVSTRRGQAELFIANADASNARPIGAEAVPGRQPAWSPSGEFIAFHSERNGQTDIYVIRADGTGQQRLTDGVGIHRDAAWTADSLGLVITSDQSGNRELYYLPANGGSPLRLTTTQGDSYDATIETR